MKVKEYTIYRIFNKETGKIEGSYSRSYHDEYDFGSVEQAKNANCHGMFKEERYQINKYKVTYELIEEDCQQKQNKNKY